MLVGFLTGVGFQVAIAVLGEMLGIEFTPSEPSCNWSNWCANLRTTHLPTLAVSAAVVIGVFLLGRFATRFPGRLIAVVGAVAASAHLGFRRTRYRHCRSGGRRPAAFAVPQVNLKDLQLLIGIAGSCFVMIVAQSAATARFYATRHHQRRTKTTTWSVWRPPTRSPSVSGTFVVNGSPTQTAMVESSGGRSQIGAAVDRCQWSLWCCCF